MILKLDSWVIIFINGYSTVICITDLDSDNIFILNDSLWCCGFQLFSRLSVLESSNPLITAKLCLCFNLIIAKELHQAVCGGKMFIKHKVPVKVEAESASDHKCISLYKQC